MWILSCVKGVREFQQASAISDSSPKNITPDSDISSLALCEVRAGSDMANKSQDESISSTNNDSFLITDVDTEPSRILARLWKYNCLSPFFKGPTDENKLHFIIGNFVCTIRWVWEVDSNLPNVRAINPSIRLKVTSDIENFACKGKG